MGILGWIVLILFALLVAFVLLPPIILIVGALSDAILGRILGDNPPVDAALASACKYVRTHIPFAEGAIAMAGLAWAALGFLLLEELVVLESPAWRNTRSAEPDGLERAGTLIAFQATHLTRPTDRLQSRR